jgi:hypothetical protein
MVPHSRVYHQESGHGVAASRRILMLVFTLALGMALFATFYGLIVGCDRL